MEAIFKTANKMSDFADEAPPLPNIFIGEIYSPSNNLPSKCQAHLSTAVDRKNKSLVQRISEKGKLKNKIHN